MLLKSSTFVPTIDTFCSCQIVQSFLRRDSVDVGDQLDRYRCPEVQKIKARLQLLVGLVRVKKDVSGSSSTFFELQQDLLGHCFKSFENTLTGLGTSSEFRDRVRIQKLP